MKKFRGSTLSVFIREAHKKNGFLSAFIYGYQGVGKTTYALKVMYYVYKDWNKVLEHTFFYLDDALPLLREAVDSGKPLKAILFDDAGTWLIKYAWGRDFNVWFSMLYNLIRSVSSGVLFTSVEATDVIKYIRDKVMYRVKIEPVDETIRVALGYYVGMTPKLERYVVKVFEDYYKLELPADVRMAYEMKRREAIEHLFEQIGLHSGSLNEKKVLADLSRIVNEYEKNRAGV